MSKKQKTIFWPALIILSIATGAFVFAEARSSGGTGSAEVNARAQMDTGGTTNLPAGPVKALNSTMPPGLQPHGLAQIVRFTVYDAGIFPKEAHASPGWVAIHIQDMSGASSGLVVLNESRQTLGQIVRDQRHWRANARMHLEPGRYLVLDASRPTIRATLIVEQ